MAGPGVVGGDYDAYSDAYASLVTVREQGDAVNDPYGILSDLLEWLRDVGGQRVLDAGCGEGYLARVLDSAGARVTGIDISPQLIEQARAKDAGGTISYRAHDLSQPLPELAGSFDAVASYLVLNDVPDYQGFVRTIGDVLRPGGRAARSSPSRSVRTWGDDGVYERRGGGAGDPGRGPAGR